MLAVNASKQYKFIGKSPSPANSITVSGEGEAFAIPDIATFTFSVSATNKEVLSAQQEVTRKIDAALALLKENDIAEKDIKTASYDIYPKYEYAEIFCVRAPCPSPKQELIGYEVSQSILVKVRDIKKAGVLLGGLGGVSVTNVSGLTFSVDDEDAKQREARSAAIDEARQKAKQLASDLGVRLGPIMQFSESGNTPIYGRFAAFEVADKSVSVPNIPTGETRITSQVSITYEIR